MNSPFEEYYDAEVESNAKDFNQMPEDEMWSQFRTEAEDAETLITSALTQVWSMGRALFHRFDDPPFVYNTLEHLVGKLEDAHGSLMELPAEIQSAEEGE